MEFVQTDEGISASNQKRFCRGVV